MQCSLTQKPTLAQGSHKNQTRGPIKQIIDRFQTIFDQVGPIWTICISGPINLDPFIWTHQFGPIYLDLSIWTRYLDSYLLTCLFGPIYLDPSTWSHQFGPIYLDLSIRAFFYLPIWTCVVRPLCLKPSIRTYFWTSLFGLAYLDPSTRYRLFGSIYLDPSLRAHVIGPLQQQIVATSSHQQQKVEKGSKKQPKIAKSNQK